MKKVYINRRPVLGPWGGGNKFVKALSDELKKSGISVSYELSPEIDVIFCFDPRPDKEGIWYQDFLNHKSKFGTKIIQRVGDVGSHSKPDLTKLVIESVKCSDHIIFPSLWSKEYIGFDQDNFSIIPNAPLGDFYNYRKNNTTANKPLKVITHHWSMNTKKGFEIYSFLGEQIKSNRLCDVEFTYVGRYNRDFSSAGVKILSPVDTKSLTEILPKYDLYLTASLEEAGANHVLEAMACGLPVLYRKGGGSIEEYCKDHGEMYENAEEMLEKIKNYMNKKWNSPSYSKSIEDTIAEYLFTLKNTK